MKTILLLFFSGLFCFCLGAQTDTLTPKEILISKVYLLDSVYTPGMAKRFSVDDTANFLEFLDGKAVLTGRSRGTNFYFLGKVNGVQSKKDKVTGNEYTYCYLNLSASSGSAGTLSIEIQPLKSGLVQLHVYQKLGSYDRIFIAHVGTPGDVDIQPYAK